MQLTFVRTDRGSVRITDANGGQVEIGQTYPLGDSHTFTVLSYDGLLRAPIEIKCGDVVVQTGTVYLLSGASGRMSNNNLVSQPYAFELDPEREIFPLATLVETLLKIGVSHRQISVIHRNSVSECVNAAKVPNVVSDGSVTRSELPSRHTGMEARGFFVVSDARWAITYVNLHEVTHIYLWLAAIGAAQDILKAITRIKRRQMTPSYTQK